MRIILVVVTALWGSMAFADVSGAVSGYILPKMAGFARASAELSRAAQTDCRPGKLRTAYQTAFDTWTAVADMRIGPSESGALSIAFWPDDRGFTPRALSGLIAAQDPIVHDPDAYAQVSVAARGFFALEMLLYDPAFASYDTGDYTCGLVRAIAADLAQQAQLLDTAWSTDFAATLTSAGQPGNATYLDRAEAIRALYTQILGSLEFTADSRIGRPLGSLDRPRPRLAEAWRSGRSLRNVVLSTKAAQALAHHLSGSDLPQTDAALAQVLAAADNITDPAFQDVGDPQGRFHAEVLQQAVRAMRRAIETEIGAVLGIAPGFNSQDGD